MMRLGASTARFWGFERDVIRTLGFISEYFNVAEIWVEPPFYPNWRTSKEKADLDRLMDVLVVTELETTVHAPHHELSLCSWNPAVTATTIREIIKSLEMASEINSKAVTFHAGKQRLSGDDSKNILRGNLEVLDDTASEYSSKLCLENPHDGHLSIEEILDLTKDLKSIYLTLDLAHLSAQKTDLSRYKTRLRRKVGNVHVSRIDGRGKHRPLASETKFMKNSLRTLKEIKYKGAVILEGATGENPEKIIPKEIAAYKRMIR
ncbi:MAG: TIM barrel protein [Candidatus Altiarchaeota archaeon]